MVDLVENRAVPPNPLCFLRFRIRENLRAERSEMTTKYGSV